jgi:hypothetical protein
MPRKPKTPHRPSREEATPIPDPDAPKRPRTVHSHADHHLHRELNWKVLVITLVIVLVAAPSAYFLHGYQVNQLAYTFRDRANQLEAPKEGEPDLMAAARHVQNYLRLQPNDVDQRIRLANLFGQIADDDPQYTSTAARMYRQAIAALNQSEEDAETREPKIIELRRKTVPLLLAMGQFKPAEIEVLRQPRSEPDAQDRRVLKDPEDRRLFARAILGRVQIGAIRGPFKLDGEDAEWTVGDVLKDALELSPGDPELTFCVRPDHAPAAGFAVGRTNRSNLSEAERVEDAEKLIEDMVAEAADKSPQEQAEIYLTAYRYREFYRNKTDFPLEEEKRVPGESDEERQEREAQVETKKQELVKQATQMQDEYLDQALKLVSDQTDATIEPALRANILMAAAGREQQLAASPQSENGDDADTVKEQVAAHWQQAEQYIRRAMAADPSNERPYLELGSLLIEQNQLDQAIEEMQAGLKEITSPGFLLQLAIAEATLRLKQDPKSGVGRTGRIGRLCSTDTSSTRRPASTNLGAARTVAAGQGPAGSKPSRPAAANRGCPVDIEHPNVSAAASGLRAAGAGLPKVGNVGPGRRELGPTEPQVHRQYKVTVPAIGRQCLAPRGTAWPCRSLLSRRIEHLSTLAFQRKPAIGTRRINSPGVGSRFANGC